LKIIIEHTLTKFLAFVIMLVTFSSCDNDLQVNADYKETIVIFGLLDPNQPKQFIKINKAFLTNEQSVAAVAQIEDSIYFSDLKAELIEEQTGRIIPLTAENIGNKKPGIFLAEPNYMYTTTEPIIARNSYQIHVENLKTGLKADSRTEVVDNAVIFGPANAFDTDFTISNTSTSVIGINLIAGNDARLYDVILDFDYEEFNEFDTANKTQKRITWKIMDSKSATDRSSIKSSLSTKLFFDLLTAQIDVRKDWVRRAKGFQVTYIGGGEELGNYISVTRPSIGIVQKQSEYTNIRNGLGIFSSRNVMITRYLSPSPITISTLTTTPATSALGF